MPASAVEITDSFSDYNVVPAGRSLFYDFVAYNYTTFTVPDLQITLKSTGAVDVAAYLYCNPSWRSKELGQRAGPSNAIYRSEEDVLANVIYIASNSDLTRPPNLRKSQMPGFRSYVPAYNCSVISNDASQGTRFQIDVSYNYRDVTLIPAEQGAMKLIWDRCCAAQINSSTIEAVKASDESDPNSPVLNFRCGRWTAINDLYGGNPSRPWLDFCQVAGNQCTPQGRMYKLDMSSFGLVCPFPQQAFEQFDQLQSLDLSDNFELSGNVADVFETLQGFKNLQLLDLSDVSSMVGPLIPDGTPPVRAGLCQLVGNGLMVLNIAEIGLEDAELPACLFDDNSDLQELRVEFNQLSGTIPDVFSKVSKLRVFTALSCGLGGGLPPSIVLAEQLEVLDLGYNFLSGTIPADMGSSKFLRYLFLMANQLTGAVPETLAAHPVLQALDLSKNRLAVLPSLWTDATAPEALQNAPLRNLQLSQNAFAGKFPSNLMQLPQLTLLQLASNKFTGVLPVGQGMFGQLRMFNVSNNKLQGTVPDDYSACGVFTLPPINALGSDSLQDPSEHSKDEGATLRSLPHVFDVSSNQLSGTVPSFLLADNVPAFVRPNVNIKGNKFTVQCGSSKTPEQLVYMAKESHLCPQTPPPGAMDNLSEETIVAEAKPAEATSVRGGASEAAAAGGSSADDSKSRLPAYGIALITLAVVLGILAVVAWVGVQYYRARARGEPFSVGLLLPSRNSRSKQFSDLEMTSGMDPLGFGPPAPNANAQMLGNGESSHPLKSNGRSKGGFL